MSKQFWDKEYKNPEHLALSNEPSGDLISFARWVERNAEWPPFPKDGFILDLGCGNGRNIISLCRESGMKGLGIDISDVAISQAKVSGKGLPIDFLARSIEGGLPLENESADVVLDMMTSHFLGENQRKFLAEEIARVMKPYSWFFFKTFILDGDVHAKELLQNFPAGEKGSYIHPRLRVLEHVFTEEEIHELFGEKFKIFKAIRSYKHVMDGKPHKRRTISVYMERKRI